MYEARRHIVMRGGKRDGLGYVVGTVFLPIPPEVNFYKGEEIDETYVLTEDVSNGFPVYEYKED
jgi:hypothetical protein